MESKQLKYLTPKELAEAPDIIKIAYSNYSSRAAFRTKVYREALNSYPEYFEDSKVVTTTNPTNQ